MQSCEFSPPSDYEGKTTHQRVLHGPALEHTVLSTGQDVLETQDCQLVEDRGDRLPWAWSSLATNTELQLQALKQQRSLLIIKERIN